MRPLRLLLPIVVLLVLSSGCAEVLRGRLEAEPPAEFARVIPWGYTDCTLALAIIPIEADVIGARIPEGFTLLRVQDIPGSPTRNPLPGPAGGAALDPRDSGNLAIETRVCASGVGANASANLTNVGYGAVFSFVMPPEALRDANVTYYTLKWDVLVADNETLGALRAEGVEARNGSAAVSVQQMAPLGAVVDAELVLVNETYAFSSVGNAQPAAGITNGTFLELSAAGAGRFVEWRTNMTDAVLIAGAGEIQLPPDGWVAKNLGSARTQAWYLAGTASFAGGSIGIPHRE